MRLYVYLLIFVFFSCRPIKIIKIDTAKIPLVPKTEKSHRMGQLEISNENTFIIDTLHLDHTPVRNLRVNFHFVNTEDSTHNFNQDSGRIFVHKLLHVMQILFDKNDKMKLPIGNDIPVIPVNINYILTGQKGGDGIYFHYDNALVYYNHMGARRNNSDYSVIEKYGIGTDSIINFFILPHDPDSVKSKTYQSGCVGIALGNAVKVAGIYEKGLNEWNVRGTFNHEVGHILGLYHAWQDDGCDDTPIHANDCWADVSPGCEGRASNNMMDYNAWQSALTPCQLQIIHQHLSNPQQSVRKLLVPTWCVYNPAKKIIIKDSIIWTFNRDLEGDIEIIKGGTLVLKGSVSMPDSAKVLVQPGGLLKLEGGYFHSACGVDWGNIQLVSKGKSMGKVVKVEAFKKEDPGPEVPAGSFRKKKIDLKN